MDWDQRVKDCKRRAAVVYPHFRKARKELERLDRLWTYWENRAYDASKMAIEVRKIPANQIKDSIERQKERIVKAINNLDRRSKKALLESLKAELETIIN